MAARIEDYALIGDCHTAALVARDGSIDWLCLPRFDSGTCFAALLGAPEHGRWLICPAGQVLRTRRRYRPDTLIDFMPPVYPTHDVLRIVEGCRGRVPMRMELIIRFDCGSIVPWVRGIERGIRAIAGPDTLCCWTEVKLRGKDRHTVEEFGIDPGQRVAFQLAWAPTYGYEAVRIDPLQALRGTQEWWRKWASQCRYNGEWRDAVLRSLITLKALTHAPTGGIVAAPTTSLPECLGGSRNWDYRFCWLRDATFTLYALMIGGYRQEAESWQAWLVNAVAGNPEQSHIVYGLSGERRLPEVELEWLPGYEGSRPVRIGNAAHRQHQLDVYGEVMNTLYQVRRLGLNPDENAWRVQRRMVRFLETDWEKPDSGIWEVRGPPRHFTHSKVMAWCCDTGRSRAWRRWRSRKARFCSAASGWPIISPCRAGAARPESSLRVCWPCETTSACCRSSMTPARGGWWGTSRRRFRMSD